LKNCKGLLATLEREPDSSQKQVMKLSEQKRVSERMVLLAISGLLTFTRIKYDPNQTAAPNASKYMDKIALKHQKKYVTSTLLPSSCTSSSYFIHVHIQSSSSIHLPKSHGFPIGPSTETRSSRSPNGSAHTSPQPSLQAWTFQEIQTRVLIGGMFTIVNQFPNGWFMTLFYSHEMVSS
jgi:hypothetical protein